MGPKKFKQEFNNFFCHHENNKKKIYRCLQNQGRHGCTVLFKPKLCRSCGKIHESRSTKKNNQLNLPKNEQKKYIKKIKKQCL